MAARQMVNLLRGSVRLEVTGDFPERFLNLCAQGGKKFWGVDWPDGRTLLLTVAWSDRRGLEELAGRAGCEVRERGERGLPSFLLRFRRRYALLLGLAAALACALLLSGRVWVVTVEGNETVADALILSELRRQGLRPGVYGPGLIVREVANRALLHLEDLSWMAINLHGIRAQVVVRERVERPELADPAQRGDIVAKAPGLVTGMEVWSGDAAVAEGATVLPGEVLIRGSVRMDPPLYSEEPVRWMAVRPMGRVEGRTWRTLTAAIPLTARVKTYTGEESTRWSLIFLDRRLNFFGNSSISTPMYDKISETWAPTLPGGAAPPVALRRETLRGYETEDRPLDLPAARALLEETLLDQLKALLGETGQEVSHRFTATQEGEWLVVELTAECTEELGRFVPAQQNEGES